MFLKHPWIEIRNTKYPTLHRDWGSVNSGLKNYFHCLWLIASVICIGDLYMFTKSHLQQSNTVIRVGKNIFWWILFSRYMYQLLPNLNCTPLLFISFTVCNISILLKKKFFLGGGGLENVHRPSLVAPLIFLSESPTDNICLSLFFIRPRALNKINIFIYLIPVVSELSTLKSNFR